METSAFIRHADGRDIPIRRVKHGEKISEPGIYDMPMSWYHSDCCIGPSVSSSGLRTILNYSPLHYWDTSPLNPDRREKDTSEEEAAHFRIGRAGHTLLIEPHDFKRDFITRPSHFDSWRTNDAKKWRAEKQMDGFTVLDPKEMQNIHGVADSLRRHPLYEQGLLEGDLERSIIWQDKKTGVWLKARPDAIPVQADILADLKIVTDARARPLAKKIYDLGYDVQMGLSFRGIYEILAREMQEFVVVAVEAKPPHAVRIAPIPMEEIRLALILLRKALDMFAACYASGDWQAFPDDDTKYLYRPDYAKKRIEEEVEKGLLPKEF